LAVPLLLVAVFLWLWSLKQALFVGSESSTFLLNAVAVRVFHYLRCRGLLGVLWENTSVFSAPFETTLFQFFVSKNVVILMFWNCLPGAFS